MYVHGEKPGALYRFPREICQRWPRSGHGHGLQRTPPAPDRIACLSKTIGTQRPTCRFHPWRGGVEYHGKRNFANKWLNHGVNRRGVHSKRAAILPLSRRDQCKFQIGFHLFRDETPHFGVWKRGLIVFRILIDASGSTHS